MKNKNLQIILVIFLVLVLPGGILALYFLKPKKTVNNTVTGKTPSIVTDEMWTTHVVNGAGNPDTVDDEDDLYQIDNLARWLGTTRSEIYEFNPKLNKQITYFPYGYVLQLPKI